MNDSWKDLRADLPMVAAIAATYAYFLLFDQFALLDLLQASLPASGAQAAMAAMGVTGLLTSFWVAALLRRENGAGERAQAFLMFGFALASTVAFVAPLLWGGPLIVLAGLAGLATALITVPLAAALRELLPSERGRGRAFGLRVGLGTGLAYFFCNLPPVFAGSAVLRSQVSGVVAIAGLLAVWHRSPQPRSFDSAGSALTDRDQVGWGLASLVLSFLALIWLDSAAFAVIQENVGLKGQTWGSGADTLLLGSVHLLAALIAGRLIDAGFFRSLLLGTFGLFALALALLGAAPGSLLLARMELAGPIYAAAVSIYSVALVAFPSYGREAPGLLERRFRAGLVFGVAGWLGSALGVGMAQNLHEVPNLFLLITFVVLVLAALLARRSPSRPGAAGRPGFLRRFFELHGVTLLFLVAGVVFFGLESRVAGTAAAEVSLSAPQVDPRVAAGRRVYIAEGCIYCHSQYIRPGTPDELLWGPHHELDRAREKPPLIGLRRQGPDLSNVGARHDAEFLVRQLRAPRSVDPDSTMPSYDSLFAPGDARGPALVLYLESLR